MLSDILKHEFELMDLPFSLLPAGFRAAPTQLLYRYHRVMDITRVKAQLGYRDIVPVEEALELTVKWYLDHPLSAAGERERNLGDPFDYAYEDQLIGAYRARSQALREDLERLSPVEVSWRHPYPHPQKRGDLR